MNEIELAAEINKWFNSNYKAYNPNFWNRNPVAKAIKSNMRNKKHWKGLRRGERNGRFSRHDGKIS